MRGHGIQWDREYCMTAMGEPEFQVTCVMGIPFCS